MYSFMKELEKDSNVLTSDVCAYSYIKKNKPVKKYSAILLSSVLCFVLLFAIISMNKLKTKSEEQDITFTVVPVSVAEVSSKKSVISIPQGVVKAHPFLPYRVVEAERLDKLITDVPKFDLVEPPDFTEENTEAAKIMDTAVSGILFDKYSPSAILNIDGSDYLVKKGDVVRNYKVLNIAQDSVTVQLGKNTYKAGIGEMLTDGSLNHNEISNLSKKFGGEK